MTDKWYLRDWLSPQRTVVGTLRDVHHSASGDEDTSVMIEPDEASQGLLPSRFGDRNTAVSTWDQIECEVCVVSNAPAFEQWIGTMLNSTVTAQGVYVDDLEHDNKSELHPLDIVVGQVTSTAIPGGWLDDLAARFSVELGRTLFVYRFAAASDHRADDTPPLAPFDRTTTVNLPMPPQPAPVDAPPVAAAAAHSPGQGVRPAHGNFLPRAHVNVVQQLNADMSAAPDAQGEAIVLSVLCSGEGFEGPGYAWGEVAAFWGPDVQLTVPSDLDFGYVQQQGSKAMPLQIRNAGAVDVTVNIAAGAPENPFTWNAVSGATVAVGATLTVDVLFAPKRSAAAQGTLTVTASTPDSPYRVQLTGTSGTVKPE